MATHLKIKTDRETATHFCGVFDDHTLCGLDINGDERLNICTSKMVTTKVTNGRSYTRAFLRSCIGGVSGALAFTVKF